MSLIIHDNTSEGQEYTSMSKVTTISNPGQDCHQGGMSGEAVEAAEGHGETATKRPHMKKLCGAEGCPNGAVKGSVCFSHGAQRPKCRHPSGCTNNAVKGGVCCRHGATQPPKKTCREEGCANLVRRAGVCESHGERRIRSNCTVEGCTTLAFSQGLCCKHGAPRVQKRCAVEGCDKLAVGLPPGGTERVCQGHGAPKGKRSLERQREYWKKYERKKCTAEGCANNRVRDGVCERHGATPKTCREEGCTNRVVKGGVCMRHGAKQTLCNHEDGCTNYAWRGGRCKRHRGDIPYSPTKCGQDGCTNNAHLRGRCYTHGGRPPVCSVEGCANQARVKDVCRKHREFAIEMNWTDGRKRNAGGAPEDDNVAMNEANAAADEDGVLQYAEDEDGVFSPGENDHEAAVAGDENDDETMAVDDEAFCVPIPKLPQLGQIHEGEDEVAEGNHPAADATNDDGDGQDHVVDEPVFEEGTVDSDSRDSSTNADAWTDEERRLFSDGIEACGSDNWGEIARNYVTTRTPHQIREYARSLAKSISDKKARGKECCIDSCSNLAKQRGGVCYKHGTGYPLCRIEGCLHCAQIGGVCRKHGACSKLCSQEGCDNKVINSGVCIRHGAKVRECNVAGCEKQGRKRGLCARHSARPTAATSRLCKVDKCTEQAQRHRLCARHGGLLRWRPNLKICSEDGCSNKAKQGGVCYRHGAKRKRCNEEGCTNQAVKGGVCIRHGAAVKRCSRDGCSNHPKQGGVCQRHLNKVPQRCIKEGCNNRVKDGGLCWRHHLEYMDESSVVQTEDDGDSFDGDGVSQYVEGDGGVFKQLPSLSPERDVTPNDEDIVTADLEQSAEGQDANGREANDNDDSSETEEFESVAKHQGSLEEHGKNKSETAESKDSIQEDEARRNTDDHEDGTPNADLDHQNHHGRCNNTKELKSPAKRKAEVAEKPLAPAKKSRARNKAHDTQSNGPRRRTRGNRRGRKLLAQLVKKHIK